jgi:hypothetical protein
MDWLCESKKLDSAILMVKAAEDRTANDRFHAHQSTSLGSRCKRGEQKQAVGRSRGGRNTKIHALADAKGRLIAVLLTGGQAHDCPIAERLIRRVKPSKCMLGDALQSEYHPVDKISGLLACSCGHTSYVKFVNDLLLL